jgi:hypothetical protein
VFGGLMFLPELAWFAIPHVPHFTKDTIPYLAVVLAMTLRAPRRVWRLPREPWVLVVTLAMLAGGLGTALTNGDHLSYGTWRVTDLAPLTITDGLWIGVVDVLGMALPFFLGGILVRERRDLEELMAFLASAGLLYSLLALIEVRASPQLHTWVYGYAAFSDFQQAIRFGGYRPNVFMHHGLAVALFFVVTGIAAGASWKVRRRVSRVPTGWAASYLAFIVVMCKSLAAALYAFISIPLAAFASAKWQQRVAALAAAVVILYPVLREADLFPTSVVLSFGDLFGSDRKGSMQFRFNNEDDLLKKARQRPWFGWGLYDRNEVFDDGGHPVSVTDGEWIITFGVSGTTGFLTEFGLLVVPILLAGRRLRRFEDPRERRLLASLSLMVAFTAVDLLPNGRFANYPFFLSGALLSLTNPVARPRAWDDAA